MREPAVLAVLLAACTTSPCPAVPVAATPPVAARDDASSKAIAFGETFRLSSAALGEQRVINVYLPPDYATSRTRFPVLFALDGGMQEDFPHIAGVVDVSIRNEVIRPLVIVGIENTERRRDLVSATSVDEERKIAPHAGGTDRFRRFLREELRPEIATRYRVSDESAVVGESFAGLFVLETLLQDPELFDAYIAIDPSVWWNGGALVKSAPQRFATWSAKPKRLFVATADYKETQDGIAVLMQAYRDSKPAGLTATYEPLPAEHHSTVFPVAEVRAYRALFASPAK
jgi:predicted alpha/beta superfamily hydrolase